MRIKQGSDRNRTEIGSPKVTGTDYNTVGRGGRNSILGPNLRTLLLFNGNFV